MGRLTKNANSVKDLRPLKEGERITFHGAGFHIVKDEKIMAKSTKKSTAKKGTRKGASTLKKVNKLAKSIYKDGKAGYTWQEAQKKAGKEVKKG